jgi:hypothetical protein
VCAKHTKEKFMKSRLLSMGMLAGLLTFGLLMFGCDHNPRPWDGEPGGVDSNLVRTWYEGQNPALRFSNYGEVQSMGDEGWEPGMPCIASGGKIKINWEGQQIVTGTYSVSGTGNDAELTLSIPALNPEPMTFTATAQQQ